MKQLFILFLSLSLLTSCIEKQSVKPTSSNSQRWLSNSPVRMNDQSKRTVRIMPQSINDITISAPPESTAYLVFNNSSRENMIQLVKTGSSVSGEKVTRKQFLNIFGESLIKKAEKEVKKLKAMKAADLKQVNLNIKSKKDLTESKQQAQLGHVVNYYRGILTGQIKSDDKTFKQLSRNFYDYLIQPTAHLFKNKTALVIVPDGILGFLPFETLMTPDGQYLAEKYRITYTQSLKILDIVNQRQYSSNRKTLLAMGGAIYDASTYKGDIVESSHQLASLDKNVTQTINRGGSLRSAYGKLGIYWDNLPGTLNEVKSISTIFPDAKILKGRQVTEANIKRLSDSSELQDYKILHFATHGITIPEIPSMSSIVLSQFKQEGREDGYLRTQEIAKLKLKADFVNLSACQTGLGKIYKGEGVVGLMHAFMIAGANALSTSLWEVDDDATKIFMENLYSYVQNKGMSYADAMTVVKRQFIRGDFGEQYKIPYYWSGFVYYGKI